MRSRRTPLAILLLFLAAPAFGQEASSSADEPPLRRWLEIQNLTLYARYRIIESSADVVTSNQMQYKDTLRLRFNIDRARRFSINLGAFSGSSFISTWNNTGVGTGAGDVHDQYVKQLFASAEPIHGLEVQLGGLYVARGESTEFTTYDEDGYVVGTRLSVRRPGEVWLDEVTVTRGMIGPFTTPSLWSRREGLEHPNYTQVLAMKRFSTALAGSLDYSTQSGADTLRAAVTLRMAPTAPISSLRFEHYRRVRAHPAGGFAVTAERALPHARLQAWYATIDEFYGGWNADRIQRGRRVFSVLAVPLSKEITAQFFATQAFSSTYSISNRTRFDAMLIYDVVHTLRRTGVF
jgi:hypothetical protein